MAVLYNPPLLCPGYLPGFNLYIPNFPAPGLLSVSSGEVKIGEIEMKYAIIESGGKQYKAVEGETIDVDLLHLEAGTKVKIDQVLLVANDGKYNVGTPTVSGAKVDAVVVDEIKAKKILVFKYKPKINYRVRRGHRQKYTRLEIKKISIAKAKKAAKKETEDGS